MTDHPKILPLPELHAALESDRKAGRRIVFTNGCFDLLHVGHVRYLAEARRLGDLPGRPGVLVVAINSDASVQSLKGAPRPLVPQDQRAEILAALEDVDYVTIFDAPTPLAVIQTLLPDVLVKGGDWPADQIVGREAVLSRGGRVVTLPFTEGASTTGIVDRILQMYGHAPRAEH
ncbi:MAG: D-glycero-beta-D-manno-heptose 1-phosphate adenylyltransferase [Nitrospirae bacterium]|nr:D-glycero-beta-D-manno-heptose 1-phosphate adenylyltransferase [Nitrospirota bacterium]